MALATSAPAENVKLVFAKTKLKKYFDFVIDASGVTNGKPAPDIFLKAAKKLGVRPKNCVVFEDAPNGVRAARQARMRVVAVTTTYTKKQLPKAGWYIKNFVGCSPENFLPGGRR